MSMACRLKMLLYSTSTYSKINSNYGYITSLEKIKHFASTSFYQIELDVPRLTNYVSDTAQSDASKIQAREMCHKALVNYVKRNHVYSYIQS